MAKTTLTNGLAGGTFRAALNAMFTELYAVVGFVPVAGNWYQTLPAASLATGSALSLDTIRFHPVIIRQKITISELAARMSTNAASQNVQFAIYVCDLTTGKPTGAALAATGNVSTNGATGPISAALAANVQLEPGLYFFAANSSSNTPVFSIAAQSDTTMAAFIGSATLANIMSGNTTASVIWSLTQTFGTWPNVTAGSFTEYTSTGWVLISFKVASVP